MNTESPKSQPVLNRVFTFVFGVIGNNRLEQKGWFRFLRVVHILLYAVVVLATIGIGWEQYNNTVTTKSTLICPSGKTWDALNNDLNWSTADQCGICTKLKVDVKDATSLADLGKQIKAVYPGSYTDRSDEELGRSAKEKYHQAIYQKCDFTDPNYTASYDVKNETRRDSSPLTYVVYPLLGFLGALLVVKIIFVGLVYIFAGRQTLPKSNT